MPNMNANGIQIEYDTFGDRSSPPLLLIMGFSGQMILWDEELCDRLAKRGHYVIRFDNRDVGLSTKIEEAGEYDIMEVLPALGRGEEIKPPYTLDDMADDAIGLLDGLGLGKAHVCGASMGGMIAQTMAIRYPGRLLSLISMASSTGNPELASARPPVPDSQTLQPMPVPQEREAYIEYMVDGMRELAGPGFFFDDERVRDLAAECYDRSFYPQGAVRQLLAIISSGNRKPALARVNLPTLVIHGDSDPLVPVEYGRDTAEAVPGAELLIIEGMGHDLPRGAWRRIVDAIAAHTRRAGTRQSSSKVRK
jgi:pimeloyl-ACP methyl ester carboxylesterase